MAKPAERGAYTCFDLTRWAAASLVVIEHWRDLSWVPAAQGASAGVVYKAIYLITGFGAEAVAAFFVLSGFWITTAVARRIDDDRFWRTYLTDRLTRLLVVVVPALVIGAVLDWTGRYGLDLPLYRGTTGTATIARDVAESLTPVALAGNLLFLQTILIAPFGSNGPLWSLANEFWYYVWYPALVLALGRRKFTWPLAGLAIVLIAPHLLPGFAIWLLGSLLAVADRHAAPGARWPRWCLAPAALVLIAAISASRLRYVTDAPATLLVGAGFAVFAWTLLRVDRSPPRLMAPLARFGAEASFSLYVVHFPVLALVAALAVPIQRLLPSPLAIVVLLAGYVGAVALAWLFSRVTEQRTAALRRLLAARLGREAPRVRA